MAHNLASQVQHKHFYCPDVFFFTGKQEKKKKIQRDKEKGRGIGVDPQP